MSALALSALTVLASVFVVGTGVAAADAGHGIGLVNITTNGFTHPWQGGWVTDVGTAWCIQSGSWNPRATDNRPIPDVPAARGVSRQNRNALAFALWKYADTTSPTTAAGLATTVHGLSGDHYASTDVPSMTVSNTAVYNEAVRIYHDAIAHSFWIGAWQIQVAFHYQGDNTWASTVTVTSADHRPISGAQLTLTPGNVVAAEHPGAARTATTDASGRIRSIWHQADTTRPITLSAKANGPGYYAVWQGPAYTQGPEAQRVVTPRSDTYTGYGQGEIPTGQGRVHKTTTNPAYQSATGVTYDVRPAGSSESVGTFTVGADGTSNTLTLPAGGYVAVETSAPAGVLIDSTPHPFTINAQSTTDLALSDPVAKQAHLNLVKVDSVTGEPVPGAVLDVAYDTDGNGTYETDLGDHTTGETPLDVAGLAAGNYLITEIAPPPGYLPPKVPTRAVTVGWNETLTVTFDDHRTPTLTTFTQSGNGGSTGGDVTVGFGAPVRDVSVVNGLASSEHATVHLSLYGPAESTTDLQCDPDALVWSGSYSVTGSGHHASPTFTPARPGVYGYVATLDVPGVGTYSGGCGDAGESVTVTTPTIATVADADGAAPGTKVRDTATVTNLDRAVSGATIHTTLYGPFKDRAALDQACASGDLGTAVGAVTDPVTGSGNHRSSPIRLPARDAVGVYTFIETLHVPGLPPITHRCGSPPETFTVAQSTAGADQAATTAAMATLPETGYPSALLGGIGVLLICAGAAFAWVGTNRRRRI